MTTNADLARWGEPPADKGEETLADFLTQLLEQQSRGEPTLDTLLAWTGSPPGDAGALLETSTWLDQLVDSVVEHSGLLENTPCPTDAVGQSAAPVPSTEDQNLPDPFPGEFRLRTLLGESADGKVWLADDLARGSPVVLQWLRRWSPGAGEALAILRQEMAVFASVQHPNLVRVHGLREAAGESYLVRQYVGGGSFAVRLQRGERFDWTRAGRAIADIGEALTCLHARGIVHRDVRPATILWDPQKDETILSTFGLLSRLPLNAPRSSLHSAPEALAPEPTTASDVYSLAATLFTLITGAVPFPAGSPDELLAGIRAGLPNPDPRCTGMPEAIEQLLRAGLQAVPERRPTLGTFTTQLRATFNQLLADRLAAPPGQTVSFPLRLRISREAERAHYVPVAPAPPARAVLRDMKRVPPQPDRIPLRTGDRVRLEVRAGQDGFLTVCNVGPQGHVNLLYPHPQAGESATAAIAGQQPLQIEDIQLTPPAGREHVFAVWSRTPLGLNRVVKEAEGEGGAVSRAYRATRVLERMHEMLGMLSAGDWQAVVVELDHQGDGGS
jgi:serine/threonine protein kinase